jgi:cobalt-precorrin-5B (C1)-methyltransferase
LTKNSPTAVSVTLPKGKTVELKVVSQSLSLLAAQASTVKDAGDDPDVTHGATLSVYLQLSEVSGVTFVAGSGVGTVTKPGLSLAVGEPAINPVPRKMITDNLHDVAARYDYNGGFIVTISIENGENIAQKTMNPRLGILGGLSVLGTSGVVRPFSCAAWIASIYQGIDVAHANGIDHIAASTGNASEDAIRTKYQLDDTALIEMGDFAGAVLKYLKKAPMKKLSVCGGFGKISKLANGHMDLNSRVSAIDFTHLAATAASLGASTDLQQRILQANTSIQAYDLCLAESIDLATEVCQQALIVAQRIVPASVMVEVSAIDRQGRFIAVVADFSQASSQ